MILILMGVSGSGKTSVGKALSELTGWQFLDADDYHSAQNVAKMSRGEPLTDADRRSWLKSLSSVIKGQVEQGENTILACSALKKSYRLTLSLAAPGFVNFVYLKVSQELLQKRLNHRKGHFMKPEMLFSQIETLEAPTPNEAMILQVQVDTSPKILAIDIQNKLL